MRSHLFLYSVYRNVCVSVVEKYLPFILLSLTCFSPTISFQLFSFQWFSRCVRCFHNYRSSILSSVNYTSKESFEISTWQTLIVWQRGTFYFKHGILYLQWQTVLHEPQSHEVNSSSVANLLTLQGRCEHLQHDICPSLYCECIPSVNIVFHHRDRLFVEPQRGFVHDETRGRFHHLVPFFPTLLPFQWSLHINVNFPSITPAVPSQLHEFRPRLKSSHIQHTTL